MKNKTLPLIKLFLFIVSISYLFSLYAKSKMLIHQTGVFSRFSDHQLSILRGFSSLFSLFILFFIAAIEYLLLRFFFKKIIKVEDLHLFKMLFFSDYAIKILILTMITFFSNPNFNLPKILTSVAIWGSMGIVHFIIFRHGKNIKLRTKFYTFLIFSIIALF